MSCGCRQSLQPKYGVLVPGVVGVAGSTKLRKEDVPHCLGIAKTEKGLVYGFAESTEALQFSRFLDAIGQPSQRIQLGGRGGKLSSR